MQPTGRRDIVVIGGSAGSVEAVKLIACGLSHELLASVLVVLHTPPRERNLITEVLNATSSLPANEATEGEPLVPGRIYVPPPDRHLIVAKDHVHVTRGPKEGLHRPSINMTFRSAANSYAERVIGVLLSGQLDDGASGLWEIARHGGVTIVQDPEEALFPSMPRNALHDAPIDYRVRSDEIALLVNCLVSGEPDAKKARAPQLRNHDEKFSGFSCPECHGPLWQVPEGPPEFQCRVIVAKRLHRPACQNPTACLPHVASFRVAASRPAESALVHVARIPYRSIQLARCLSPRLRDPKTRSKGSAMSDYGDALERVWRSRVQDAKLRLEFAQNYVNEIVRDLESHGRVDAVAVAAAYQDALQAETTALVEYQRVQSILENLITNGVVPDDSEWLKRRVATAGEIND